ncbi:deoxyuridine 5'-triphosphate nucleotidohydrolase [Aspergillus egyptiacus]|nr:deoxyuridine 5'-triphosphate nucleotidohydrolase [Aspergillus egyptiacus]
MILPGRALIPRIISHALSPTLQTQPCSVDLTLKNIHKFTSAGTIDFDNSLRERASYAKLPFEPSTSESTRDTGPSDSARANSPLDRTASGVLNTMPHGSLDRVPKSILIQMGSYSVEFNEIVDVPLDMMGQIFTRSSLYRSGAFINTGLVDSGYAGPLGGMLVVSNPHGIRLVEGARLAQIVFHQLTGQAEAYNGVYQQKGFRD